MIYSIVGPGIPGVITSYEIAEYLQNEASLGFFYLPQNQKWGRQNGNAKAYQDSAAAADLIVDMAHIDPQQYDANYTITDKIKEEMKKHESQIKSIQ